MKPFSIQLSFLMALSMLYFKVMDDIREGFKKLKYSIYYPGDCAVSVPDHICNECEEVENGRVRSVAFIKTSFVFTDPTNPVEWRNGIENKDIIIVPQVLGSYNGGDPQEGTGYGDLSTRLTGYNHELTFRDPNYKLNGAFYNALKHSRLFRIAWRTSTQTHISDNPVSVFPQNPVTETLTDQVDWNVIARWQQADLSEPFDTPAGIFDCFAYDEA